MIRLATINLEVANPERSKRFYVDALGMIEDANRSSPPDFIYLRSAGADVTLAKPAGDLPKRGPSAIEMGFETDDLDVFEQRLSESNMDPFRAQSMGWGSALEGHDLDGNRIIVYRLR